MGRDSESDGAGSSDSDEDDESRSGGKKRAKESNLFTKIGVP